MKRLACLLLAAALAASSLIGCSSGAAAPATGGVAATGGAAEASAPAKDSLNFGMSVEPITINPYACSDSGSFLAITQVLDTLVLEDENGNLVPSLAESWEFSDDRKEITFKIRDGVKFHNGDPLTAEDVAYSLNKAAASTYSAKITGTIEKAEVTGDLEVKLTLKYAYEPILSCLSCAPASIVSKAAMEADEEGFGRNPVGTGPFKFVEWKNGESLSFTRNDDYFKGPAAIKDVTLKIYTDQNTAVYALENGEIDALDNPIASELQNLRDSDKINLYEINSAMPVYVAFNTKDGLFANQKLRQAVSYAVNREDIILGVLEGNGMPVAIPIAPTAFGYPEGYEGNPYDPEKGKQLVAEAGYPDGVTVSLKCTEAAMYSKTAQVLQDELRQIGINVELDVMEKGAFLEDLYASNFEIAVWAIISMFPDADYTLYARFHSSMLGGSNNFFLYENPKMDELLDASRTESDPEKRKAIFKEICDIITEEAPLVTLYCGLNTVAANKDLKGVTSNSTSKYYFYNYSWQ